jgi:hypothetical protein
MAQCMAMGQAAGTAAAMATRGTAGGTVREVAVDVLRARLAAEGAILGIQSVGAEAHP